MNTKLALGILAAVVVIGGGAYFYMNSNSAAPGDSMKNEEGGEMMKAEAGEFKGSVHDLMARGGDWKCDIGSQASTGAGVAFSSGTVYVSGKKLKGDFSIDVPSLGNVSAYMVSDGEYIYSWSSVMLQGFKAKVTAEGSGAGDTSGYGFNPDVSYSYNCEPAAVDASMFTPPANVQFRSI